jgi:hypothetical protein
MNSLLSLVTFLPMIGAVVLTLFLRGEDAMAQRNAKLLGVRAGACESRPDRNRGGDRRCLPAAGGSRHGSHRRCRQDP